METNANSRKGYKEKLKKKKYHFFTQGGHIDTTFLLLLLLILSIGLIMLFSASYAEAYYWMKDSFFYIKRQIMFAIAGVIIMFIVSYVDYRIYKRFSKFMVIVSLLMLIFVFTQKDVNDARRWIFIGELFSFQPSEIAKFSLILFFAQYMTDFKDKIKNFWVGIVFPGVVLGIFSILMILEPHLSGTILMVLIALVLFVVAGVNLWQFFGCIVLGTIGMPAAIFLLGKWDRLMTRVEFWLHPETDPLKNGFQILQSLYAIGSGGLMGVGIGNSRQKYLYLPESKNDYIFSVVCEEVGFIGATIILLLFALFVWRGFTIALKCKNRFGCILACGLIAQIGIQVILNVAVVSNTIPSTGISLPFFSYGGTSLVMLLAQMGILLSISRESDDIDKEK